MTKKKPGSLPDASEIIARLGGTCATARMFKIRPPCVSRWIHNGIPAARLMYLEGVHPQVLAPINAAERKQLKENRIKRLLRTQ